MSAKLATIHLATKSSNLLPMQIGSLATVGSGEYSTAMFDMESLLLNDGIEKGKRPVFVQLATAAGREGADQLKYWETLGMAQAKRLDVEVRFLPVFDRAEAESDEYVEYVSDAALIYFSGGDPNYLATTMRNTVLWQAIQNNFNTGGSLAGCSAGAMFLSTQVPRLRFTNKPPVPGVGLLKKIQVIPHFNRIHKFVPDTAVRLISDTPDGVLLIGVDDETSLIQRSHTWSAWGTGNVQVLNGETPRTYKHGEVITGIEGSQ